MRESGVRYNGGMTREAGGGALPNLLAALPGLRGQLGLGGLALLLDFDGTISPIVSSASGARVDAGCKEALVALAPALGLLAFVSGRPAQDVARLVGVAGATYVGTHGWDRWQDGQRRVHPQAQEAAAAIEQAGRRLRALLQGLSGLSFEDKGLTFAVHYRNAPEVAQAEEATLSAADEVAAMLPVRVQRGRRVVELQPLLDVNKGTAVFELLEERAPHAALYVGDDYTDAAAMRGLGRWSDGSGKWAAGVAVASEEMPEELVRAASYRLEGLGEVRRFLQGLQGRGAR